MLEYIELEEREEVEKELKGERKGIIPENEGEVVKTYRESKKLKYPYIKLKSEEIELHRVKVLKGMLENTPIKEGGGYVVYLEIGGVLMGIGEIKSDKLRNIITSELYRDIEKEVVLEEGGKVIKGTLLYALISNI